MAGTAHIALVGDYSPDVIAHRAIPLALALARTETSSAIAWHWVATRDLRDAAIDLADFAAVWVVPASPYENMAGALDAVRFARETCRPFLGTCGGFQHALIEFARHVAGLADADHAETNPTAGTLVVAPLACSLVERAGDLHFAPGSLLHAAYGRDTAHETYHCSYGVNPAHRAALEDAGLHFTAFDNDGAIRAAELPTTTHPFFVGTLFQPERAALTGATPPLVRAFVYAATHSVNVT
jgi:CTP synthase (UTP-ammonia lyase)